MKLWMSAEVQHDVSEPLRQARLKIERTINQQIDAIYYGNAVETWALITILRPHIPEGWGEIWKYHGFDRTAEFRLAIDHASFKRASAEQQMDMLARSLLRSLDLFPRLKVPSFDLDRFRKDIEIILVTEKWLTD